MEFRRAIPPLVALVVLLIVPRILSAQEKASIKEPPIPVVIHSPVDTSGFRNEELMTLSISDFNRIMEREDSLRRAYTEQTQKLLDLSDRKSLTLYLLVLVLVISNVVVWQLTRNRFMAKKT